MAEIERNEAIATLVARLACRDEFAPILAELGNDLRAIKFLLQQIIQRLAEGPVSPEEIEIFKSLVKGIDDRMAFFAQLIVDNLAKIITFPDSEFEVQKAANLESP